MPGCRTFVPRPPGCRRRCAPISNRAPLAALLLGMSSGFPYAMIGATLTTRLAQHGIDKRSVTAFSLAFLVYNLKFLWAPRDRPGARCRCCTGSASAARG